MDWLSRLFFKLKSLLWLNSRRRELDDDIQLHLEMMQEDLINRGIDPEEARNEALREFGNVGLLKEEAHQIFVFQVVDDFWRDLKIAFRQMLRQKSLSAISIGTVGLSIGLFVALVGFYHHWMIRPFDIFHLDRVVQIGYLEEGSNRLGHVSYRNCEKWVELTDTFEALGLADLRNGGHVEARIQGFNMRVAVADISPGVWDAFEAKPILGEVFSNEGERLASRNEAVLSYDFWRKYFDADVAVLGRRFQLQGEDYIVVAVMNEGFATYHDKIEVWRPLSAERLAASEGGAGRRSLMVMARLAEDVDIALADRRMKELNPDYACIPIREYLAYHWNSLVAPVVQVVSLFAIVALLIGCLNVSNLLLIQVFGRMDELRTRQALGATDRRIGRQVTISSVALFLTGGFVSLPLIYGVRFWLLGVLGPSVRMPMPLLNLGVVEVIFSLLLAVALGILVGLLVSKFLMKELLRLSSPLSNFVSKHTPSSSKWQWTFVAFQVSFATSVAIVSIAFGMNAYELLHMDYGFESKDRSYITASASRAESEEEVREALSRISETLTRMPQVESVALASRLPLMVEGAEESLYSKVIDGKTEDKKPLMVYYISPDFFEVIDVQVLESETVEHSLPIAYIDENVAREDFPNGDYMGSLVEYDGKSYRICGVVESSVNLPLFFGEPMNRALYLPYGEGDMYQPSVFVLKTVTDGPWLNREVQSVFSRENGFISHSELRSVDELVVESAVAQRTPFKLIGIFAVTTLAMSLVSAYAIAAYQVARRRKEIGIHLAVGASTWSIIKLVFTLEAWLCLVGLLLGQPVAISTLALSSSILTAVPVFAPSFFILGSAAIFVVTTCAALFPTLRVSMRNPVGLLKVD